MELCSWSSLEDPTLIQAELNRRLEAARNASPAKRREETLTRELAQANKSMERLLTAYQEELLSLDELRRRMPELRRREQTLQAELEMLRTQVADQATHLRLAQTLSTFLETLRANAQTLDVRDRQRLTRLLVKEVVVGDARIAIRHSIPNAVGSSGGNHGSSNVSESTEGGKSHKSYLLCPWRDVAALQRMQDGLNNLRSRLRAACTPTVAVDPLLPVGSTRRGPSGIRVSVRGTFFAASSCRLSS
jgi:site-specific DNA recombinase